LKAKRKEEMSGCFLTKEDMTLVAEEA
jgi:hypothetical protein